MLKRNSSRFLLLLVTTSALFLSSSFLTNINLLNNNIAYAATDLDPPRLTQVTLTFKNFPPSSVTGRTVWVTRYKAYYNCNYSTRTSYQYDATAKRYIAFYTGQFLIA